MKKYILFFILVFAFSSSAYAADIVELDSDGHITLVDQVKNTKDKFFPDSVQGGPTDSEFLNQIIESSVAKVVSVSSGGWSDLLLDVYDLIGVSGSALDSAVTVTQEAIDKINDWFDLSDDGFIKTSASWHTDMSHIYNLKGFDTVEGGAPSGFFPVASYNGLNYNNVPNLYFTIHESRPIPTDMFNRIYVTAYWSGGSLWSLFCMRDGVMFNRFVAHWGGTATNILPNDVVSYMGGSYNPLKTIDAAPKSNAYPDLQSALDAFFGEWPAGGTFYNHSMYMNTNPSYDPDIFIRSLPATNWQQVSNNRYNLVGSDPTEDSINNTFNSNNPVYTYIDPAYNFEIPYALTHSNSTVYDFDLSDDYDFSNIDFSPSEYEIENGVMIVQDVWEASPDKIKAYILAILSLSVAFLFIRS